MIHESIVKAKNKSCGCALCAAWCSGSIEEYKKYVIVYMFTHNEKAKTMAEELEARIDKFFET